MSRFACFVYDMAIHLRQEEELHVNCVTVEPSVSIRINKFKREWFSFCSKDNGTIFRTGLSFFLSMEGVSGLIVPVRIARVVKASLRCKATRLFYSSATWRTLRSFLLQCRHA
mmetsp:Transcript_15630/g.22443  ORF Transcript_15630/g.22443 Transcript_15630/m.22443 type:complete len:113 (+) Transcript_15630:295-633(+)